METINSIGNAKQILREVSRVIVGKDEILIKVLLGIVAGGHILMEDIPGVGKTTMALGFSKALGLEYNRVQFTPDVLPSDVTGYSIYDKNTGTMNYQRGAVLCNLFLADELNRATSRTQSALLQAMEEGEVTVDNNTYPVPQPFVVIQRYRHRHGGQQHLPRAAAVHCHRNAEPDRREGHSDAPGLADGQIYAAPFHRLPESRG